MVVPSDIAIETAYQHAPRDQREALLRRPDETKCQWLTRSFFAFQRATEVDL
jgi:hypothetical protein